MNILNISNLFDSTFWIEFFESFAEIGPIAGIFLVMIEAFIPILPLYLFVAINVMIYGFWQGYLYSWIGNVISSILLFFFIKKYGTSKFQKRIHDSKRIRNTFNWIQEHGFFPIFILLSFPFTPSFLICGLSALARIDNIVFIYSIIFGKLIMIFSLSFIGYNISEFIYQPLKSSIFIVLTLSISLIAKLLISLYERKREKSNQLAKNVNKTKK